MALMKCKACGGEYQDTTAGGVRYFHVCPPVTHVRVERGGQWTDVPLADLRATDAINVSRAGATVKVLRSALQADDIRLGDTLVERPNKRDENVKIIGYDKAGNAETAAKLEGDGVEPVVR